MSGARPGRDGSELVALYRYSSRNLALRRQFVHKRHLQPQFRP